MQGGNLSHKGRDTVLKIGIKVVGFLVEKDEMYPCGFDQTNFQIFENC